MAESMQRISRRRRLLRAAMAFGSGLFLLQAGGCAIDSQALFGQVIQVILYQLIGGFVSGSFNLV